MEGENLIADLGKAFEEFKATHAQEIAEVRKGFSDVVTVEKLSRIDDALNALSEKQQQAIQRADALEKRMNRPGLGGDGEKGAVELKAFNASVKANAAALGRTAPVDVSAEGFAEYKAAFDRFLRYGKDELDGAERKALSVGSDPDGGYLVTPDMSGRIVTRMFETSPMRSIASVQVIGTDALEGIRDTDEAGSGGWVSETATRSETTTPAIAKWRIPVYEMYAKPKATQQLIDDANVDIEAWLAAKVADKLTRVENAAFVTGTGSGQPRGIASYTTAATTDATRSWGVFEHVLSGASADFAGSNPADKLFDLVGAMKDAYLTNARWLTRREVMTKVRKFKESTTNGYLWQPGLQQGQPQTLLGFPVTIAQDMPALAADSLSLAFGDFREAYQIVDRIGFRTLRDPYSAKPFVEFYTTRRVGGGAVQFEAVKFLKFNS
jgi:HK97 family phage major capsid protein